LSSVFLKNTGGTQTRRLNSDLKRIEGWLYKLRLTAKAIALAGFPLHSIFAENSVLLKKRFVSGFRGPRFRVR
jgi:hypothetical protein